MQIKIVNAQKEDKNFIIHANREINIVSGLSKSHLIDNIDKDLFSEALKCFCLMAKDEREKPVGMCLYSKVYWANLGEGIYLSQAYISPEYRRHGIFKTFIDRIKMDNKDASFITCMVGSENETMQIGLSNMGGSELDLKTYYLKK